MKISLITTSLNSELTIEKTLISVKNQTYKNIEHILVDGGSKDSTLDIAKKYILDSKIISESDNGIYDAINKGIRKSSGEIIGILNSDDTFYNENSLQIIINNFSENIDCVFGNLIYTDKNEKVKRIWRGSEFKKGSFKKGWMPAHPTFYCRKKIYDKYGLYDDTYKIAGDFELMLNFLEKFQIKSKFIPSTIINMKIGGVSNKSIKTKFEILKEEFRAFKENNIPIHKLSYIYHKAKKIKEFKF